MFKLKTLLFVALCIFAKRTDAQIFDDSQAHYRTKWRQISHEKFNLIFPSTFTKQAPRLAQQIEQYIQLHETQHLKPLRKVDIILQQNHVEQNGFMQLAPRKSELFAVQSGISTNQQWLPNLALHELRHTAQFDNLIAGTRSPFFQQLALALFGITLPSWYFEGDAVLSETIFSNAGRGRLASWDMPIRTILGEKLHYDFNKHVHGSFKDILPTYYTIGYLMSSEMREIDSTASEAIYQRLRRNPLRIQNFNHSLKETIGLNSKQLFNRTLNNISQNLSDSTNKNTSNPSYFQPINDKYPTDYLLPQVVDEHIYAIEISRQHTSRIVKWSKKSPKKTHVVTKTGLQINPYFHIQKNLIVWDEMRKHPRYDKETYSIINLYDSNENTTKTISKKGKLYSPIISSDLKKIWAIGIDSTQKTYIASYDISQKNWTIEIKLADELHIIQPQLNENNDQLIAIGISDKGTNLLHIDLKEKIFTPILDWSNLQLERPYFYKNQIIFKANQNGKDDIFAWKDGKIKKLTISKYGAFNPSVINDTLWYNDYNAKGYAVAAQPLAINTSQTVELTKAISRYSTQNNLRALQISQNQDTASFKIENYNTFRSMFNFHSLSLSGNDFESFQNFRPGLFWLSNNVLNTTKAKIGYEYDLDTRKSIYSADITFQKWYPKLKLSYLNRGQIGVATDNKTKEDINFEWRENFVSAEIQLPFTQYKNNKVYAYGFNFGTSYLHRYHISLPQVNNFDREILLPLNYQIYYNRNTLRSKMDIVPRWGQNISMTYRNIPFDQEETGQSWSVRGLFYFPGILANHGIQVRISLQENNGRYTYHQDIPMIDGFAFTNYQKIKNTLLFNYYFPLAYPDLSIGELAYIKRIRGIVATHYQNIQHNTLQPNALSIGAAIDFNMFKYTLPNFALDMKATYLDRKIAKQALVPTISLNYSY